MRKWLRKQSNELKLFGLIWLVYAVYVMPAGGTLPNRYLDLIHSIVNEQRFEIDTYHENTEDSAYFNGHYYSGALPGPAFLGVPAYVEFKGLYLLVPNSFKEKAGGVQSYKKEKLADSSFYGHVDNVEFFFSHAFLTLMVIASVSALGSVLLFKSVRVLDYNVAIALGVSLLYAFGTNVFFYSTGYFHHTLSATLGVGALYIVLRLRQVPVDEKNSGAIFLVGLLAGSALTIEYSAIITAIWLVIWLLFIIKKRQVLYYCLGLIPPGFVLMTYNWSVFGNPLATSYSHLAVNSSFHTTGFFGLTYPHPFRLVSLLISKEAGLFLFVPISLIGVWGILHQVRLGQKNCSVALICGLMAVSYLVFYSAYTIWSGGSVFGPRFLIPALPFILLGVAFAADTVPAWLIAGVGALSVFINWAGAQFGYAVSPAQHIHDIFVQGPTLPAFGAILTHSTSHESAIYLFAARYHTVITLALTMVLIGIAVWAFRGSLLAEKERGELGARSLTGKVGHWS